VKLRLIYIGRDRNDPLAAVAEDYASRICRYYPFELLELKETPLKNESNLDKIRASEADKIRKHIKPGEHIIALHERGKALDSVAVSKRIETWTMKGPSKINFVIGGPVGLDRAFLAEAQEQWTLSLMTFPHRLARVVLVEQIYRACTILRGEPYHK
jgi:23S rRNA (pseudouridine1915-N3)-methyltransferase